MTRLQVIIRLQELKPFGDDWMSYGPLWKSMNQAVAFITHAERLTPEWQFSIIVVEFDPYLSHLAT